LIFVTPKILDSGYLEETPGKIANPVIELLASFAILSTFDSQNKNGFL